MKRKIGSSINEKKDGFGKYVWVTGDSFTGTWKDNRMDGPGVFIQANGNRLEGTFKNNYFHMGGNKYVNPLDSQKEIEEFISNRTEIEKIKEERLNEKNYILQACNSIERLQEFINQSRGNDRIPLITSTKDTDMN